MISGLSFNFTSNPFASMKALLGNLANAGIAYSRTEAEAAIQTVTGANDPFHQTLLDFSKDASLTGLFLTEMPYHIQQARQLLEMSSGFIEMAKPARAN